MLSHGVALADQKCIECEGKEVPLFKYEAEQHLQELKEWHLSPDAKKISKALSFKNFTDAFAFASKVAALADAENHHPDLSIGWGKVGIELTTHSVNGLSLKDCILAAKIDRIV